ncbi:uncharacterized protein LOC134199699 [Bombyx mori]|uniref:uncharacterized protein LOC134199699 n=1 Tax=Bombyx mori TaxID=7091 RepID=UPI002ED3372C
MNYYAMLLVQGYTSKLIHVALLIRIGSSNVLFERTSNGGRRVGVGYRHAHDAHQAPLGSCDSRSCSTPRAYYTADCGDSGARTPPHAIKPPPQSLFTIDSPSRATTARRLALRTTCAMLFDTDANFDKLYNLIFTLITIMIIAQRTFS